MLFNFVLYLTFLTFFYSRATDGSFVDKTHVWRKYKISILVSIMSLILYNKNDGYFVTCTVQIWINLIETASFRFVVVYVQLHCINRTFFDSSNSRCLIHIKCGFDGKIVHKDGIRITIETTL